MRTDDALAVAYENRLAPQRCIPVEILPAKKDNPQATKIASEAEALFGQEGVGIHPDTMADIHGCLVNHGVAFAVLTTNPREDGSRIDVELKFWPIEFVRWDPLFRVFKARVDPASVPNGEIDPEDIKTYGPVGSYELPIVHGDGRWVIFKKHDWEPFKQEAALLSAALVWARHAFAVRDWAKGSVAHGAAKVVGEMPAGVSLQDADGELTDEAAAFLELLRSMASDDAPVGIQPSGSKVQFLTNTSTAWQVWSELVKNAEAAAARIYLGTDGTLGSKSDAPGVNIEALFGVATTRVQGDLACLERGIDTGVIEPWCAMNFGDSTLAPKRRYQIPDEDADAVAESFAKRNASFWLDLKGAHDSGIAVDQKYVDELARKHNVPAPTLKELPPVAPPKTAAPPAPAPVQKPTAPAPQPTMHRAEPDPTIKILVAAADDAAEKLEAERIARALAEQTAAARAEQIETEQLARILAERSAAERAEQLEAERTGRALAQRLEAERTAQLEIEREDRARAEQATANVTAKLEAERIARALAAQNAEATSKLLKDERAERARAEQTNAATVARLEAERSSTKTETARVDAAEHAARMTAALIADIREAEQLGRAFTPEEIETLAELYGVPAPKQREA